MFFLMRVRHFLQQWRDTWMGSLDEDETALGIEPLPLQGTYQIWVSFGGQKLFWLSGHHTQDRAEAALGSVLAWAKRLDSVDPVAHAVEMALLRDRGDFRAQPLSERIEDAIRQRIRARTPDVIIVRADLAEERDEGIPDEATMQMIRTTHQVTAWMQLQADPYDTRLALARQALARGQLQGGRNLLKETIGLDPARPEAFNLLGILELLSGHSQQAKKYFRVALDLDPTYNPAHSNLLWSPEEGGLNLG